MLSAVAYSSYSKVLLTLTSPVYPFICTGKQNLNQRRESVFGANVIATAKRNKIKQKVSF